MAEVTYCTTGEIVVHACGRETRLTMLSHAGEIVGALQERIAALESQLAAREREHRAWEAMRSVVVWNLWKHERTGVWYACLASPPLREMQAADPVDAVILAADAAKGDGDG